MNLYIETDNNGNYINHPAFEDNLIAAFGSIPAHWEPFTRVEQPIPTVYQVLTSTTPTYQKINGVWTDVWPLRDMTDAEKTAKQQLEVNSFNSLPNAFNFSAWILDEATCTMQPPTPMPTDGQQYFWSGLTTSWKVIPPKPTDGQNYKLSYLTDQWQVSTKMPTDGKQYVFKQQQWAWVEVTPPTANT